MPRKEARRRVERGLYREGKVFWACETPAGSRQLVWEGSVSLGSLRRAAAVTSLSSRQPDAVSVTATQWPRPEKACARAGLVDVTFHALRHVERVMTAGVRIEDEERVDQQRDGEEEPTCTGQVTCRAAP